MQRVDPPEYTFGQYSFDPVERVLRYRGVSLALAPKVADTLLQFVEEPGRLISKAELMERIWPGSFVDESNLTQNIYVLRKLFEERGGDVRIENVPKRGYRLSIATCPAISPAAVSDPAIKVETRARRRASAAPAAWGVAALALAAGALAVGHRPAVTHALSATALGHYSLARYYLNRATEADLERSRSEFDAVRAEAPQSALGPAGLAEAGTSLSFYARDGADSARRGAQAIADAREAVAIDPGSAEAYAALGGVESVIEHDRGAANASFERALSLDPDNLEALELYGTSLMDHGEIARARSMFGRAMSIEPDAAGPVASLAWADFLAGDYRESAELSKQLLRAHRLEWIARITLASASLEMRDFGAARPEIDDLLRKPETKAQGVALLAQTFELRGNPRSALSLLDELERETNPESLGVWDVLALAAAYARAGREDQAFLWLHRIRESSRGQIVADPRFEPLRRDARFATWVRG